MSDIYINAIYGFAVYCSYLTGLLGFGISSLLYRHDLYTNGFYSTNDIYISSVKTILLAKKWKSFYDSMANQCIALPFLNLIYNSINFFLFPQCSGCWS